MVDNDDLMDLTHLGSTPNISFHMCDMFDAKAEALVQEAASAVDTHVCLLVGVHLCGELSHRAIGEAVQARP